MATIGKRSYHRSSPHNVKHHHGPVEQLDPVTGRVIARFPNLRAAGAITHAANISECAHGRRFRAGGFGWRYVRAVHSDDQDKGTGDRTDDRVQSSQAVGDVVDDVHVGATESGPGR